MMMALFALRLVASATSCVLLLGTGLSTTIIIGAAAAGGAGGQSSAVLDLNFADLDAAAQAHPLLAVAFYAPRCGRCQRLLPSWNEAAELLGERLQPSGIKLARMDVTSRGGMRAWKELDLERVPSVKVFVGHSSESPLPYKGHLDAGGIAAHLEMLQRDRRRLLEHQEKYGNTLKKHRNSADAEAETSWASPVVFLPEPVGSGVTLLTVSSDGAFEAALPKASLSDRFQEVIGRERLSLVLFMVRDSPKARHMATELRKSVPLLLAADSGHHPTNAIRVDLSPADRSAGSGGTTSNAGKRAAHVASARADAARLELAAATGVPVGDDPELRIFLDGQPWVDKGTFKGMPTAEGIRQHMQWVAIEAQLTPLKREPQTDTTREKGHGKVLPPESEDDSSASSTSRGRNKLVVAAVIGSGNVGPLVAEYEHDGRRDSNVE